MKTRILIGFVIFVSSVSLAQPTQIYTLKGDSMDVFSLARTKPLLLVYYSSRSCYDCFGILREFLEEDSAIHVLFVIEKTNSPLLNVEIKRKLMNKGISEMDIYYIHTTTTLISPYVDLIQDKTCKRMEYTSLFDDKKEFVVSDNFKSLVREFYPERRD